MLHSRPVYWLLRMLFKTSTTRAIFEHWDHGHIAPGHKVELYDASLMGTIPMYDQASKMMKLNKYADALKIFEQLDATNARDYTFHVKILQCNNSYENFVALSSHVSLVEALQSRTIMRESHGMAVDPAIQPCARRVQK